MKNLHLLHWTRDFFLMKITQPENISCRILSVYLLIKPLKIEEEEKKAILNSFFWGSMVFFFILVNKFNGEICSQNFSLEYYVTVWEEFHKNNNFIELIWVHFFSKIPEALNPLLLLQLICFLFFSLGLSILVALNNELFYWYYSSYNGRSMGLLQTELRGNST